MTELTDLLAALGRDPDERIAICTRAPRSAFTPTITTVGQLPHMFVPGGDTWYSAQPLHARVLAGKGHERDVVGLRELYADLDVKDGGLPSDEVAHKVIADLAGMLGADPAGTVQSGHGHQPHWALERGEAADWPDETDPRWLEARALIRRWGRLVAHVAELHGGHVDAVYNMDRILRAPGTLNVKDPECPVQTSLQLTGGSPVSLDRLREVLDEYNVREHPEDRQILSDEIDTASGSWTFAASTCGYVAAMVAGWATDSPDARHPWLVSQAIRLAAAHRLGCISSDDHVAATSALAGRFRGLLATGDARAESPGEIYGQNGAFAWGVAKVERMTDDQVTGELGNHSHEDNYGTRETEAWRPILASLGTTPEEVAARARRVVPPAPEGFWSSRPELAHVHAYARARRTAPWAVLFVTLARIVAAVEPGVSLPPLVGGRASCNLFVALVGPSGAGKDAALAVSEDAVPHRMVMTQRASPGSGEGIAHAYMERVEGVTVQTQNRCLFIAPEIDSLAAVGGRRGATLLPELRRAWTGADLGFQYADKTRRMPVPAHAYRLCLIVGVQPRRAAALLDDSDGGTPQRFVWAMAADPEAPDVAPPAPEPLPWLPSTGMYAKARRDMSVCDQARAEIDAAHLAGVRGQTDALDRHAMLARLKIAAAMALWAGRLDVTDDDWALAGVIAEHSTAVRNAVVTELSAASREANQARAHAEADRAVIVTERTDDAAVKRVIGWLARRLAHGAWEVGAELRRGLNSRDRKYLPEALDRSITAGLIEAREIPGQGTPGREFRVH